MAQVKVRHCFPLVGRFPSKILKSTLSICRSRQGLVRLGGNGGAVFWRIFLREVIFGRGVTNFYCPGWGVLSFLASFVILVLGHCGALDSWLVGAGFRYSVLNRFRDTQ